ncbi:MAG: ABC transporter substrate-binding protein [Candidatus Accumulibacter sp.]|jgi:iron(III) transport system substrate-binding protein|nr:ABC transporter substrate-binding protein [Accumulibacter sp.]
MRFAKLLSLCSVALLSGALSFGTAAAERLYVYTSTRESIIGELKVAFTKKYPDIRIDFLLEDAGRLRAKVLAEHESGKILADVLWTSEVPDFYQFKDRDLLLRYTPTEIKSLINPLPDYDGSFTVARLSTVGIAYNTRKIKKAPTSWNDLKKPEFKNALGIANPTLSGTAYMSVAMLSRTFGWEFFEALQANGAKVGRSANQVVDDTASGKLVACLAVDYIAFDRIGKGAPLRLVYPREMLVVPGPVAIFKDSPNVEAAKKFVDFILSREGQTILAKNGTLPVRTDVKSPKRFRQLPTVENAIKRAIEINYQMVMAEKEETIKRFTLIMRK